MSVESTLDHLRTRHQGAVPQLSTTRSLAIREDLDAAHNLIHEAGRRLEAARQALEEAAP